jgi:hypothetical protein
MNLPCAEISLEDEYRGIEIVRTDERASELREPPRVSEKMVSSDGRGKQDAHLPGQGEQESPSKLH